MRVTLSLLAFAILGLAGCITPSNVVDPANGADVDQTGITPVTDRASLAFRTDDAYSHVLTEGLYEILPALSITVDVPAPLGQGLPTQTVHMGVFMPKIDGCDWGAATLPDSCKVPVVADVGPYYGEPVLGDVHATEPAHRLGEFLINNLVPHGYAIAQVSVLGTGDSGGCMDLMGEVEQAGVQGAVDYLGTAAWSNGAVGLIGRSYDGSTPWEAAMVGSPYLKTVVPISGLTGQQDLMWRNGSAESRGPGVLWGLYYAFTYTGNEGNVPLQARQIAENLVCPDTQAGAAHGVQAYATGDKGAAGYWDERSFGDDVLANYEGSVYFIHGMQDWNVDPHMAFPFYNQLEAKGLEMKGLFGQWAHMYPDRPAEHESCGDCTDASNAASVRWDWAQDLLEWFDHYLKGTGAKPQLHVEIQDDHGRWRIEPTYPAPDTNWTEVGLPANTVTLVPGSDMTSFGPVAQAQPELVIDTMFDSEIIIAGQPQLKLAVTPMGPGGQVYAEIRDADDGGRRLGHAIMDLRYAAGGTTMQPVVPGVPIVAMMEFEPMDAVVPAGHKLVLYLAPTGQDYLPSATSAAVEVDLGASQLILPIVKRTAEDFFAPPGIVATE